VTLILVGLAAFLGGALPLVAVAEGRAAITPWRTAAFATSVPAVLWALGLAIHATFFDPQRGIVESLCRGRLSPPRWVQGALRAYAAITVAGFAVAPLVVLGSAAFA
ncbi:MAG: hypothetical protein HKP30_14410, partial [Myxococcales bacterium]|nr:hypothetical protein [Myxococcales bacterium]